MIAVRRPLIPTRQQFLNGNRNESCNQNAITEVLASGKDSSWLQAWRTTSATLDSFDMTEAQKNGEVNTDPATVELAWLVFEPSGAGRQAELRRARSRLFRR